jgi:hypothetical protein
LGGLKSIIRRWDLLHDLEKQPEETVEFLDTLLKLPTPTFTYLGFRCWFHPTYKTWGGTLSRAGRQMIIFDGRHSKKELMRAIELPQ